MKVIKYFLIGALLLALWVTAPLWMPKSSDFGTSSIPSSPSEIDYNVEKNTQHDVQTYVKKTTHQNDAILKQRDREQGQLELKFGNKSDVIKAIKSYWTHTYNNGEHLEFLRCSTIDSDEEKGWITTCSIRLNGEMQQETYTVNNGFVSK